MNEKKKEPICFIKPDTMKLQDYVLIAMFGAIAIILGMYPFTFMLGENMKITFSQITNTIVSGFYGPIVGGMFGGALDILKFFVNPTGSFFPGFTISGIVNGILFGLILFKKPLTLKRVFLGKLITSIIVDIFMNTYWLTLLYGSDFMVILPLRLVKVGIMLPIDTILMYLIMRRLIVLFKKNNYA